jgi:Fe-S oxidoreductase
MKTFLDWSEYTDAGMGDAYADIPKHGGDFAKAVAVCINSRRCERKVKGVMCPSYRLNDDPSLSTGARVGLLKTALNGSRGSAEFLEPKLVEAMELCVSCKGCQRECENNVDMSRIKIEYLAQLNESEGISLRARLFSELPKLLAKKSLIIRLTGLRNRHAWLAWLGERFLGISAKVTLPEPVDRPTDLKTKDGNADKPVILFTDTFCRHYSPEIAEAAIAVLEAAGYQVKLVGGGGVDASTNAHLCCGRTYLSQGRVEEARGEAKRLLEILRPQAEAGLPIIGLEPSCLLTLRDEYSALGLGEAARIVADQALLFEEFLARELTAGRLNLPWSRVVGEKVRVLVHGHCHEKSVGAMKSMRKVLKQVPGLSFEMVDVACCGMAGSFGLEAEHTEMARAMAEQDLLPALQQQPDAVVVANGFSCRHQIFEVLKRPSIHLAQLIRDSLYIKSSE